MRALAVFAFATVLVGCDLETYSDADDCDAAGYTSLIGSNLAAVTVPGDLELRIIQPGEVVTQDFRAERLNFVVNAQGVIQRVYCG